jgi:uncharacterized membrane protein
MLNDLPQWPGHAAAIGIIVGALTNALPALATLASLIYFLFQIYHDETVQAWLKSCHDNRRAKRLTRLLTEQTLVQAQITALQLHQQHQITEPVTEAAKVTAAALIATTVLPSP